MRAICFTLFSLLFVCSSTAQNSYSDSIQDLRDQHIKKLLDSENKILNETEISMIKSLDYYPIDPAKKVTAVFTEENGKTFQLPTSSGGTKTYRKYGHLTFEWNGEQVKLSVYQDLNLLKNPAYKNYLIIPFKDATSGKETYGGGRYLDFNIPDESSVEIDFNLTYNPYCAYSYRFSCPVPPKENHLKVTIDAGEKTPIERL